MSEEVRTRILDAAVRVLEAEGARGFKQTRVAKEAGVEQGHLTYYFPKKADLVIAVLQHATERTRAEVMRLVARAGQEGTRKTFFDLARSLAKDHKRTRLLLGLAVESQGDPELGRAIAEGLRVQRKAVALLLARPEGDLDVELALAALRGIGVEHMLARTTNARVDELVERLDAWLSHRRA